VLLEQTELVGGYLQMEPLTQNVKHLELALMPQLPIFLPALPMVAIVLLTGLNALKGVSARLI